MVIEFVCRDFWNAARNLYRHNVNTSKWWWQKMLTERWWRRDPCVLRFLLDSLHSILTENWYNLDSKTFLSLQTDTQLIHSTNKTLESNNNRTTKSHTQSNTLWYKWCAILKMKKCAAHIKNAWQKKKHQVISKYFKCQNDVKPWLIITILMLWWRWVIHIMQMIHVM